MQELHAGYVCAALWEKVLRKELDPALDWSAVLCGLSHFVIDKELKLTGKPDSVVAILTNLLSRGLPTLPSLFVERALAERTGLIQVEETGKTADTQTFKTTFTVDFTGIKAMVEQALCAFTHHANLEAAPGFTLPDEFDIQAEAQFFAGPLAQALGPAIQVVERQCLFETIVPDSQFKDQRVDFCLEFPGTTGDAYRGAVIELDGPEHLQEPQKSLDGRRDAACRKAGWVPLRFPVAAASVATQHPDLWKVLAHPYFQRLPENGVGPLHGTELGGQVLDLVITPLAIARIHAVLLQLVQAGKLKLNAPTWRICVVEREYPCASLAAEDFSLWLRPLFDLYAPDRNVPKIEITAVRPKDLQSVQVAVAEASQKPFDVLLDVSVLQRHGITKDLLPNISAALPLTLRSGYRSQRVRRLATADPVEPRVTGEAEERALAFFLKNIFRKGSFREGQLDIIRRTLRHQSSIALLPTGAGKSLTYQLSALLQNGLILIVDPIKALMKDQVDNLHALGINCTAFINSTMKAVERKRVGDAFARGHYKFTFVSPERLLIKEFRTQLKAMKEHLFCFAVVDEAHCVSEWGHDFRTAYLRLGKNLRRFCRCHSGQIPILALTGTASYEVLDDIQRELQLVGGGVDIIRPEEMGRKELQFKVVPLEVTRNARNWDDLARRKREKLPEVLRKIAQEEFSCSFEQLVDPERPDHGTGLIFCPHAGGSHGVSKIRDCIAAAYPTLRERNLLGAYAGKSKDAEEDHDMVKVQDDFKNSKITVLACTSAFGMGIDKPNIRFTVHFNLPQSLESFYQEVGRAGRDRETAFCYLLYTNRPNEQPPSADKSLMQQFLNNSFRGKEHDVRMIFDLLDQIRFPSLPARIGMNVPGEDRKGLEAILANLEVGQVREVNIPFDNGLAGELAQYLEHNQPGDWTKEMVANAYEYALTEEQFLKSLERAYKNKFTDKTREYTRQVFPQIRTEGHTFRVVYRLAILGVIKDYTYDYKARVIMVWLVRLRDGKATENLQTYIARYVLREEAARVPEAIRQEDALTELRRATQYLIRFVYDKIVKKRQEALNTMEVTADAGSKDAKALEEAAYRYFDSRYTRQLRQYTKEYSSSTILECLCSTVFNDPDIIGAAPHDVSHLLGSCNRLLEENPDNGAFRVLRAFARALIPAYAETDVVQELEEGLNIFRSQEDWYITKEQELLTQLLNYVRASDESRIGPFGVALVRSHVDWMRTFTAGIGEGEIYAGV